MTHLQTNQSPRRRRIDRRPYTACDGLGNFLAREFEATDFDFGWLTFPVEQTAEDLAVDGELPSWFENAMVHDYYSGFMVTHPDHGIFLLDEPWSHLNDDEADLGETLYDDYEKLRRLTAELHMTLDGPHHRALPWRSALIVGDAHFASAAIAAGVPEKAVLLLDDDSCLPDLLPELAADHASEAAAPGPHEVPSARQLLAPLAERLGPCFIESEAHVAKCQLAQLEKAAREEDGRRAAMKMGIIEYFEPPFGDDDNF